MNVNVFWSLVEFFSNLFECTVFLLLPIKILKVRVSKIKSLISYFCAITLLMLIEYSEFLIADKKDFLFPIAVIIYAVFALNGNLIKKISVSIISTSFSSISSLTIIFLSSYFFDVSRNELFLRGDYRLLVIFLTRVMMLLMAVIVIIFVNKNKILSSKQWSIIALSFLICDWINILIFQSFMYQSDFGVINLYMGLISLCVTSIAFISFFMITIFSNENKIKAENEILIKEKKFQEQNLQIIRNNKLEIDQIKHDLGNYLILINGLIKKEKYEEDSENCEKLTGKLESISSFIECNMLDVSIMLNEKLLQCRKNNIDTKCFITNKIPDINQTDLTIIISNLTDNAIEYSLTIPQNKRCINITMLNKELYFHFIISNYISSSVLKNNPKLQTNKEDINQHGLGLKSVERLVKNNNGIIKYYEKDSFFVVEIMFVS